MICLLFKNHIVKANGVQRAFFVQKICKVVHCWGCHDCVEYFKTSNVRQDFQGKSYVFHVLVESLHFQVDSCAQGNLFLDQLVMLDVFVVDPLTLVLAGLTDSCRYLRQARY